MIRPLAVACAILAISGCSAEAAPGPAPSPLASPPSGSITVVIPDVVGLRADVAKATITSSGFAISWSQNVDSLADWAVVAQQPEGGQTGTPSSVVRLGIRAQDAPGAKDGRLTNALGLTFEVAAAVCDARGRTTSANGWHVAFRAADATLEGASLFLRANVEITEPDGQLELRTVDCVVAGSDITPMLQSFWVH